jgi:uncharacterized SAM-binding protein YcdF (DUF218 family)
MTASSLPGAVPVARPQCTKALRVVAALAVVLVALAIAAWLGREPLLRSAAYVWIVSDDAAPADAVAVFGGGLEDRPFAAADYYQRGLVRRILVSNVRPGPAERIGVLSSHVAANRRVLLKLGVPEDAIEPFGDGVSNTYEEAQALSEWMKRNGAHSVIVPTEIFSARRVRWTLRRAIKDTAAVRVTALDPPDYNRSDWWRHEGGVIGFQNEVIKYLYYRLKY